MIYFILRKLLDRIEETLFENQTIDQLSASLSISTIHLQRLFKASFETTLICYVRSRRLSASLENLLNSDLRIDDVAAMYGFEHAQSYIRAFKREFHLTPGEARKTGQILKVTPPIQLFPSNELADGVMFGPEIVHIPKILCVGKPHIMPNNKEVEVPARTAQEFWVNDKDKILNIQTPEAYIGLTRLPKGNADYTIYTPSICVSDFSGVPSGFESNTIPSCLCARFHYIGEHHYLDINRNIAKKMYDAISTFDKVSEIKYSLFHHGMYFERIAAPGFDGTYCKMEWFSPVYEKK